MNYEIMAFDSTTITWIIITINYEMFHLQFAAAAVVADGERERERERLERQLCVRLTSI